MRFAFDGVDDLRTVADLTEEEIDSADFGTYPRAQYFDDLFRLTELGTGQERHQRRHEHLPQMYRQAPTCGVEHEHRDERCRDHRQRCREDGQL
jgi:hypothetical protein